MPRGRKAHVLDTNVLIVANRRDGGSYECAARCGQAIVNVKKHGAIITDEGGLILTEYMSYLNYKGQPGVGDAFLRWFFNNRGRRELCSVVPITKIHHAWRSFEEFPDRTDLRTFDKSDQKFVATARVHGSAAILQASDHKWLAWEAALFAEGVKVNFLCREELEAVQQSKRKRAD